MSSRARYIVGETFISIGINVALSIGFVYLAFHGLPRISVEGRHGIVVDMLPQTFMVVLMSCLVPSLLTRKRLLRGALLWRGTHCRASALSVVLTALVAAVLAAAFAVAVCHVAMPRVAPLGVPFGQLLFWKAVYGMVLAAVATPLSMTRVLD